MSEPSMKRIAFMIAVLMLVALPAFGQAPDYDICILEHLNMSRLSGVVVSAHIEDQQERRLAGAIVELRYLGQVRVIASTKTDVNGHFTFNDLPSGKYSLAAKPPTSETTLYATAVEVRLNKPGKKSSREVVLALGWLFGGCHGGYATLRNVNAN